MLDSIKCSRNDFEGVLLCPAVSVVEQLKPYIIIGKASVEQQKYGELVRFWFETMFCSFPERFGDCFEDFIMKSVQDDENTNSRKKRKSDE